MTSRERVLKAFNFEETDHVPLDLGGSFASGIHIQALVKLRRYLGLKNKRVKVGDILQMLGDVEMDVVHALRLDCLHISWPTDNRFGIRLSDYKPWKLFDGTEVMVPGQFDVDVAKDGSWFLRRESDPNNANEPVEGHMPKGGYYFDLASDLRYSWDFTPPSVEEIRRSIPPVTDEELRILEKRAKDLREGTDKAIVMECCPPVGLSRLGVGSFWEFQCLVMANPRYVKELFDFQTGRSLRILKLLKQALGDNVDVITIMASDLGYQNGEVIPPESFKEVFVPFLKKQNDWVHQNTPWKTFVHSCGSITKMIPLLIESHVDILNPVQTSAKGMDPQFLKEKFGDKIVFWGGGVDTQHTLPFGTSAEVKEEVRRRISIFGSGGGFVFNPVHNIQSGVPPENVVSAYRAAAGGDFN